MTSLLAVPVPRLHDGSMPAPRARRRFTSAYKLKILAAAAQCTAPGAVGALLRREGLYSSHLTAWRAAQRAGTLTGPAVRRGPKPAVVPAHELSTLQRQLARAVARAERAEAIVELQKKVALLLGDPRPEQDEPR